MQDVRHLVMLLADISGYTKFTMSHQKALAHSQMVVGDLLRTIVEQARDPLQVSKLEGDAVFMYAVKDGDSAGPELARALGDRVEAIFVAFTEAVNRLAAETICKCPACARISDLRLKVVVHSGNATLMSLGGFTELQGVDPIVIHRLLKNHVPGDEYLLVTDAARGDLAFPDEIPFTEHVEEYADIGRVRAWLADSPMLSRAMGCEIRPMVPSTLPWEILRGEIRSEYSEVARNPDGAFHFHIGEAEARICEYDEADIAAAPIEALRSFAGTGNPFALGPIQAGERVVDVGCGTGFDVSIAARRVGPSGQVIGVDMTAEMLARARATFVGPAWANVEIREGYVEALPVPDGWADVVISNGVINLCPDKPAAFRELFRVLKPGGRLQIGDISVGRPLPPGAVKNIELWSG